MVSTLQTSPWTLSFVVFTTKESRGASKIVVVGRQSRSVKLSQHSGALRRATSKSANTICHPNRAPRVLRYRIFDASQRPRMLPQPVASRHERSLGLREILCSQKLRSGVLQDVQGSRRLRSVRLRYGCGDRQPRSAESKCIRGARRKRPGTSKRILGIAIQRLLGLQMSAGGAKLRSLVLRPR